MDNCLLDAVRYHEAIIWHTKYKRRLLIQGYNLDVDITLQLLVELLHVQLLKVIEGHESLDLLESLKLYRVA